MNILYIAAAFAMVAHAGFTMPCAMCNRGLRATGSTIYSPGGPAVRSRGFPIRNTTGFASIQQPVGYSGNGAPTTIPANYAGGSARAGIFK